MCAKRFLFSVIVISVWAACAPKKFSKDPEIDKCQNFTETCITKDQIDYFDKTYRESGGQVDIIFVNDNSGSMSTEQSHMAEKFSSFLSVLDSKFIDYQIGVITTDVSSSATTATNDDGSASALYNIPRQINGNGSLQDGKLVAFANSDFLLKPKSADKENLFSKNIKRTETEVCESYLKQFPDSPPPAGGLKENCPSGDERGIFAANLFVENNAEAIRPKAHLAFVVLADEDVRSGLYIDHSGYALEEKDKPETLMNTIKARFPEKSVSFHSIIVRPGDTECEKKQGHQMGPASIRPSHGVTFNQIAGSQGRLYAEATKRFGGVLGDICANDYGSQLTSIGTSIVERVAQIDVACEAPNNLTLTFEPESKRVNWVLQGKLIKLDKPMDPGVQVRVTYSCPRL